MTYTVLGGTLNSAQSNPTNLGSALSDFELWWSKRRRNQNYCGFYRVRPPFSFKWRL